MKKSFVSLAFLLVPTVSMAIGIEGSIGVWYQDPGGYISYKGNNLDVDRDLRYNKKTKAFGRVKIDAPLILPNIYLMATQSKFSGKGEKNVAFTFGDQNFNANVPFDSELKIDHYDIALYYGVPGLRLLTAGILNVEFGLNARITEFSAKVVQGQRSVSKSATIPVPMVYAGVQISPVELLSLEGEFRGITLGSNRYYDVIGRLKVRLFGPAFVAGGYRQEELKIDYSDIRSKVKVNGPFVEAGLQF